MIAPGARTKENELSSSVLGCQGGQGLIEAGQSLIQGEIPPRKYGRTAQVSGSSNLRGRSAGTRTLGLLLPKQARYQLRNTPLFTFAAFPQAAQIGRARVGNECGS